MAAAVVDVTVKVERFVTPEMIKTSDAGCQYDSVIGQTATGQWLLYKCTLLPSASPIPVTFWVEDAGGLLAWLCVGKVGSATL